MFKKGKKMLALMLSLVMSASVLAGCQSTKQEVVAEKEVPTATEETAKEVVAEESDGTPGWQKDTSPIDLDLYFSASWFTETWGEGDTTSAFVTEKTGVNIKLSSPTGDEEQKLNTMIVSNTLPDILAIPVDNTAVIDRLIEGDLVYALNELADEYDPYFYDAVPTTYINWYKEEDGNTYGIPNFANAPERMDVDIPIGSNFAVRKDIYEAIGSPDMSTPEGFLKALADAKEMYPEIAGQPIIPLGFSEFTSTGCASFDLLENYLSLRRFNEDGTWNNTYIDPEMVRWLKTFRQANEEGLISKNVFIDARSQISENIVNGRYFALLYSSKDLEEDNLNRYNLEPEGYYIPVEGPANTLNDDPEFNATEMGGWVLFFITKNCKDPARAISFLSYAFSEEGQYDMFWGEEGVTHEVVDGKPKKMEELVTLQLNDNDSFKKQYNCYGGCWVFMDLATTQKWQDETAFPSSLFQDFAAQYERVDVNCLSGIEPPIDSLEGEVGADYKELWGRLLPKMLIAPTEEEFDKLLQELQDFTSEDDFQKYTDYLDEKIKANMERLKG